MRTRGRQVENFRTGPNLERVVRDGLFEKAKLKLGVSLRGKDSSVQRKEPE